MELKTRKFLVTGGAGFLGGFVVKKLLDQGVPKKNITIPRSNPVQSNPPGGDSSRSSSTGTFAFQSLRPASLDAGVTLYGMDLRKWENCVKAVQSQDIVIHLAAFVGGIGLNRKYPGKMFYDNIMIGTQLMEAARLAGVEKFVGIGTVCSYPKFAPIPFTETSLWHGYPEETNAQYGLAKKMLLVQGGAYRQEYGFNAIHLIPVNLYGPGDSFHPEHSHVIPALIKKVSEAKKGNKKYVELWGTGKASREFLYVEDAAEGIILATEKYNKVNPVNIGAGREIKIKDLIKMICKLMDFKGEIRWDSSRPDGQPRRCLSTQLAKKEFGFQAKTDLEEGLKKTIEWYLRSLHFSLLTY